MDSFNLVFISCILSFTAHYHGVNAVPLDPGLVTKLMTALNSLKAALPSTGAPGSSDKSSGDDSNGGKKAGQPTSFHMDDRSPEIEVKTSDMGMDIKTKPASLQVLSTPVEPVHVHQVIEDHNILSAPPHFIAPPEIVHPIQPIYYGARRHHIRPFLGYHSRNLFHPLVYYPYRHYYHPGHHVLYRDGEGDDGDDDDEDGDKKEKIPVRRKHKRVWRKLKSKRTHGKSMRHTMKD